MYEVRAYYDEALRGLEASDKYLDWDEAVMIAHNELSNGSIVTITNMETGEEHKIIPDDYFAEFDGEFILNQF